MVSTSTVKKSAAARPSQCAARTTPLSPPRIRVYPHVGFSDAMGTTSAAMSRLVLGRPGCRLFEPSYFLATSWRNHRRMVSGVTMPAIDARRRRPTTLPFTARRRRWSSLRRSRRDGCAPENPVLLKQVLDDRLLLSIDPTGEQQGEEGERRRQRIHGASVPEGLLLFQGLDMWGVDWVPSSEAQALLRLRRAPRHRVIRRRRSFRTGRGDGAARRQSGRG